MKKSYLFLVVIMLLVFAPRLWARGGLNCVEANGLTWCYNDQACGQACDEVCGTIGSQPIEDDTVWFEAQNTEEKCQAISQALGLGNSVDFNSYTHGCLEDTFGFHSVHGGLNGPLLCSSFDGCPADHRTDMDDLGLPCGPESRRSICPCGPPPAYTNIPALNQWGMIALVMILGIVSILVYRRRKAAS